MYNIQITQLDSLINLHHLRQNGIIVNDVAKQHGGSQYLKIRLDGEINSVKLEFDGDIM